MPEIAFTRVSAKGQIVIPADIRRRLKLKKGRRLVIVTSGDRMLVEGAEKLDKRLQEDFFDILNASRSSTGFWMTEKDEVWNDL